MSQAQASDRAHCLQNNALHVKMHRMQDELNKVLAGMPPSEGMAPLTYAQKREKAKADEEALAEVAKYKDRASKGAQRLAHEQQRNEALEQKLEAAQKEKQALEGKVAALQDHLRSKRRSVRTLLLPLMLSDPHVKCPASTSVCIAKQCIAPGCAAGAHTAC